MRAVVYREASEVAVEDIPEPKLEHPCDVLVRITSSCICGSDLHMYEGRRRVDGYIKVILHP
jgi:glutathione-independent formaldehyde dehydrogenase